MAATMKKAPVRKAVAKGKITAKSTAAGMTRADVLPMLRSRAAAAGKAIKKAVRDFKGSRGAKVVAAAAAVTVTVAAAGLALRKTGKRR